MFSEFQRRKKKMKEMTSSDNFGKKLTSPSLAVDLTCAACGLIYRDPRALACLHSFCRECLDNFEQDKVKATAKPESEESAEDAITCPTCWKPTKLNDQGIDGLPKNTTLESITAKYKESQKTTVLCSLCEVNHRPAVKTCRDCAGTNYCQECLQFYHPRRGAFRGHAVLDVTTSNKEETSKDKTIMRVTTVNQLSFSATALTQISWLDREGPANLYSVKCSLEREEREHVYQEEIKTLTTESHVIMAGLRLNTVYMATVTALHGENEKYMYPLQRNGKVKFKTGNRLKCLSFAWDTADCKASIALSKSKTKVALIPFKNRELLDMCPDFNPCWRKVDGICSDRLFSSGLHYWEMLVNYATLKLMNNYDLICAIGINKSGREDGFSPVCRSHYCLCLALMKERGFPNIVMKSWDGRERSRGEEILVDGLKRHANRSVKIGFYLDFQQRLLKVVDVKKNKMVHVFTQMEWSSVSVICELYNADKVRCSVELFTEDLDVIPTVIFE